MKDLLEELKEWGCDIEGALERFLDDKEMYISFLSEVSRDPAISKLESAIEAGNVKEAFESAHSLKGIHGNMGLTPLFQIDSSIVEPLRAGSLHGVSEKYKQLKSENERLIKLIENFN